MQTYIQRNLYSTIVQYSDIFPVIAVIGPRQCGKSTLVKHYCNSIKNFEYLDLESMQDMRKLEDPELFFKSNPGKVICIDEIQRMPDLFAVLRSIIDKDRTNGRIIILGSASSELLKQSSESLAGRIGYLELTPFLISEICDNKNYSTKMHWLGGGFPESFLFNDSEKSFIWRKNFINTFIQKDVAEFDLKISPQRLLRFITVCSHINGQVFNSSKIANTLDLSYHTVRHYLDIFEKLFLIRVLKPFERNNSKRLIKSPKIYIRDTGLLHTLLNVSSFNELLGHVEYGSSWEGFCIENIISSFPENEYFFYRTSSGNEIDLIIKKKNELYAVECKSSTAPVVSKGFFIALDELKINKAWIIIPDEQEYSYKRDNIKVSGILSFINEFGSI